MEAQSQLRAGCHNGAKISKSPSGRRDERRGDARDVSARVGRMSCNDPYRGSLMSMTYSALRATSMTWLAPCYGAAVMMAHIDLLAGGTSQYI